MSYLNDEDIQILSEASRRYNQLTDLDPLNDALLYTDLDKFTFGQTASILRNNYGLDQNHLGVNDKPLTDEKFVLGWLLDDRHPERLAFAPYIDADIPEILYPMPKEDELSGLSKRFGSYEDIGFSLWASAPAWFAGLAGSTDMYKQAPLAWGEVDWKTMGKNLFEGNMGGMRDELAAGWNRYKTNYDQGKYDYASAIGAGAIIAPFKRRGLKELEDLMAVRSKVVMDEHKKDARNRAYWQYMNNVKAKDLLYGDDTMSLMEKVDYATASLASPIMTIGAGIVVGTLSRNPALGMQVASSGAFLLEGIDEWQQSFDYYIEQGYSPENASRMSHANATLYGAAAFYTERLPASRFIKGANKLGIKSKLWDSLVKKTGKYADDLFAKSPKLKAFTSHKATQLIKRAAINSGSEALEESVQLTTQTAIQYGYKGNEAFEGYAEELRESARAGGTAGFLMGPLGAGISGITERFMKGVADEGEPGEPGAPGGPGATPITEFNRDKIKIASVINRIKGLTKEEQKFAGTLGAEERADAQGFLDSLKKEGPDILNDLGISSNEMIQEVKSLFGPEVAAAAKNILATVITPTAEEEADTGQPLSEKSKFGTAGISDAELARRLAKKDKVDVITPEVEDYEDLKGDALKDEVRRRGLKVSGKVDELRQRLRDDDATKDVVEEPTPIDMEEGEIVYADPETGRPYTAAEIAEIEDKKAPKTEVPTEQVIEKVRVSKYTRMSNEELQKEKEDWLNTDKEMALIDSEIARRAEDVHPDILKERQKQIGGFRATQPNAIKDYRQKSDDYLRRLVEDMDEMPGRYPGTQEAIVRGEWAKRQEASAKVAGITQVRVMEGKTPRQRIEAVKAAEKAGEGIDVLRKEGFKHFGNPFSSKKGTRAQVKTKSVKESVEAYDKWLRGTAHKKVAQTQRDWIINQIDTGKLDNKALLYYQDIPEGEGGRSHADVLSVFINERRRALGKAAIKAAVEPPEELPPTEAPAEVRDPAKTVNIPEAIQQVADVHKNKARLDMQIAREPEVKALYKSLRKMRNVLTNWPANLAEVKMLTPEQKAEYEREQKKYDDLVEKSEFAYFKGDYGTANALKESAIQMIHERAEFLYPEFSVSETGEIKYDYDPEYAKVVKEGVLSQITEAPVEGFILGIPKTEIISYLQDKGKSLVSEQEIDKQFKPGMSMIFESEGFLTLDPEGSGKFSINQEQVIARLEAPADPGEQMDMQFQAIDQGRLPKITEDVDWAERVIASLKERFPKIEGREVEKIVNQLTGIEQAGRAFNMIAEWAKGVATIDTAPHEYAHILIDAMEDSQVIQDAIAEFKTKEALVQYMGEYYANNMEGHDKGIRSRFKTFIRKFWARVKKVFGKPAEYVAQQFAEGGEMFQGVDNIAALQYKIRGQKLVNEASMELARLKKEHGVTIKRHPTDPTRLGTIKVPKAKRREGIGRQIVDALKKEFIGKGKDLINIEVNPGSEGFWEKMGFKKTGEIERGGVGPAVDSKKVYSNMVKYPKEGAAEQEYDALKLWYEEGREIVTGSPVGRLPYRAGGAFETGEKKKANIRAAYKPLKTWLNSLPANKRPKNAFKQIVEHEAMLYREEGGIHGEDRAERLKADFFNTGVEPLYFKGQEASVKINTMEYRIPDEEMTLGPIEYQMVSPDTEGGRMATRLLDNTLNAMQAQLGKKFIIQDFIDRIASTIPSSFAEVFTYWADKHVNIQKVAKQMAIFDAYATPLEVSSAFYDVTDALNEDLASIEPNDFAIRAKNMATVEYAFMNALGIDIPKKVLNALYVSAREYAAKTEFTPQEAFEKWGDTALAVTGFKYSDFPDTDTGRKTKRRIKQLYVTNNSRVRVNPGSALIPRHRNLEYNASGDGLVWKTNEAKWIKKANDTSALNYLYEAVNADIGWNKPGGGPVWLNLSDIYQRYSRGKSHWFDKKSAVLTKEELKALAKKALNMKWDGTGPRIYGLSMLSVRGDSGHFIFAPILQEHMDLVGRLSKLELYWKGQVKAGNITPKQMYHFLGRRQNADGTWRDLPNAADTRWLAGEVARYEMMSNMMPKDLDVKEGKGAMSWMSKGSEFFRRIKILSTPVFTSPMMRDTKAMIIAKGDEKGEIWFVDRHGNEAPMVDVIRGLGKTNKTDGASIIGRTFTNDMTDAFGADPKRKLFKTAIWKADLSLAVKHEMFLPESGMQIIRVKPNGERVTIATVDDTGNIFNADGQEIDILMTDDEAKHSAYKSGETIDIKGNELGLIKYHESKINRAKFPHQWLNYVNDAELLKKIKKEINPRITRGLNRLFNLTSSDKMRPSILAQYMINLRSDSPNALTTALIEKALLGLGLHPDAHPMLNKILKTQIIDPTLQLADGKGVYLDIAPDYFDTHKGNDVSIAQADARQVYKAYAKQEGGTWKDAQNMGLNAINKWLEDNDVNALISRSPIPYVGGVFVGRIKSIHDRGGQLIMSSEHAIRRLEGDNDGDAVQVEFLPDDLLTDIDTFLSANSNRMDAVNLHSYPVELEEVNDLSRIENVYNIASKFQKGSRAIGEIANLQNVLGQMQQVFNYIELEDGSRIRVHNLSDEVYFPEIEETKTIEGQLRIWLQAAVDNGKHLLLDKWDYSRDTLISRLFYIENPDGTTREIPAKEMRYDVGFKEDRPYDTKEASIIKTLVKLHVTPGRIRNGRQPGFTYDVKTLLAESNAYLAYTRNRNAYINDLLTVEMSATSENRAINMSFGKINEISFTDEVAPLEEIAISFAKMWYGTENVDARIEPGKLTPVEFEPGVYKTVHLNTMRELEEDRDTMFQDRIDEMDRAIVGEDFRELPARDKAAIETMMKKGRDYANAMWLDKKKGFIKLLEEFGESIGPSSWDHNPQLVDWTTHWSTQFQELNEFEQTVATYTFLRGFAQKNAEGKLIFDDNRNVLPPVSDKVDFTVLDHKLMKKYLNMYNSNLRKHQERTEDFRRVSYDSFNSFIKKVPC